MNAHDRITTALHIEKPQAPQTLSVLTLAYVGDTVYDLFVRTKLLHERDADVHALHLEAAKLVCAHGQAEAYFRLEPLLTQEELAVFKRGRNAHGGTVPKNASVTEYRIATGLEALLGHLYLSGADARLDELMGKALPT
ncbi:MAG: Mini-ribonuclease 3 [Clostridiales bacterium]|nr:Mini-ribonuclease 3 [Clostridiales bacterium]